MSRGRHNRWMIARLGDAGLATDRRNRSAGPVRCVLQAVGVSDLSVALAGGAIGSAITIVAGQLARARLAWAEVEVHDEQAAECNEQLFVWVDDRTRELVIEMRDTTEQFNARGAVHSSLHANALTEAKARALHEYRDQEWRIRLRLSEIGAAEEGWHLAWRKLRRRPTPALTATDAVEPFLARWREPVCRHESQAGDAGAPVFDRTTRTEADALGELPGLPLT
jgi:hypothetical protein